MTGRPFWVVFSEMRVSLLHGDASLDIQASLDEVSSTHGYKRSSWPRLDAMVRLCGYLWQKAIYLAKRNRQSRFWRIPGALLLVYIGGYVFLNSPQLTSDAVPWYIAPSYPSTFAPTIRSTARAAPPPRMEERVIFVIHLAPVLLLWLLESCRHSEDEKSIGTNRHKVKALSNITQYPVIFLMMMPAFGIATAVSLYSAIHYFESFRAFSTPSSFPAGFNRKARSALAAVVLGYLAPVLWALARFGHIAPESSPIWAWMTFPTLLPATFELLVVPFSSMPSHTSYAPFDPQSPSPTNMPSARKAVYGMAAFCSVSHAWLILRKVGDWLPTLLEGLQKGIRLDATGIDHVSLLLVSLVWMGLLFIDLKRSGKIQLGWLRLALFAVGGALLYGPGTVLVVGWLVREEALLAVSEES
ncbi:hypothetical protein Sste5346_005216 [Sporothrix stenoceras]|uniref:Uncharacterized protein n=1 Tax=Sporothrix stenoceras TaxID=5173 RepID=A0ABR3Z5S0_9PEZI